VERAPRDRRSLDILSLKKEAKLSANKVNDVEVGRGDADLRQSNLFTVCLIMRKEWCRKRTAESREIPQG